MWEPSVRLSPLRFKGTTGYLGPGTFTFLSTSAVFFAWRIFFCRLPLFKMPFGRFYRPRFRRFRRRRYPIRRYRRYRRRFPRSLRYF